MNTNVCNPSDATYNGLSPFSSRIAPSNLNVLHVRTQPSPTVGCVWAFTNTILQRLIHTLQYKHITRTSIHFLHVHALTNVANVDDVEAFLGLLRLGLSGQVAAWLLHPHAWWNQWVGIWYQARCYRWINSMCVHECVHMYVPIVLARFYERC
jgi:hypothetical protein